MKAIALILAAGAVRALAALAGLFVRRRDGIVLISCQYDEPSQDILDLRDELESLIGSRREYTPHGPIYHPERPRIRVRSGRMRRSFGGALLFFGRLCSMLRAISASRIVVIDAYCMAFSIPKKRPGQKAVQLWHAPEAIKKFSWQIVDTPVGYGRKTAEVLCMHRNYDFILCPSDATRPFFMESFGYLGDIFVKYGLPSLDRVGLMKRPAPGGMESPERVAARLAIHDRYPELSAAGGRPLTVVYAPTFRDGAAADAAGLVRGFLRTLDITAASGHLYPWFVLVLKLHPFESANLKETGGPVISDKDFPLINWYAAADVVITDYSGVAVDAAAAGVASYYYIYDIDDYMARRGLNVDMREEAVGKYAFTDADELAAQILNDFVRGPASTPDRDSYGGIKPDGCIYNKSDGKPGPASGYDYEALAAFRDKYLEVPLSGNTRALAGFIAGL